MRANMYERVSRQIVGSQRLQFGRWNLGAVSSASQSALGWPGGMNSTRKEFSDRTMTRSTEQMDHPWNTLTTITTFDQGTSNSVRTTFCRDDIDENQNSGTIAPREQQITQATGLLIESLLQQLCTMLEGDKVRRNKLYYTICDELHKLHLINDTYNTTEFEMLRGQYQRAFYHMLTLARGELETEKALSISRFIIPKLFRYQKEFREISFIAHGGFGKVYKARHRLDGIEYAIKKIKMPVNRIKIVQQQLNEVWALAKLKHTNIVSYNAAWIEPLPLSNSISNTSTSTNHKSYGSKYQKESYDSLSINNLFKNDKRKKKRNKVYKNTEDNIINRNTISKRFEELNSSVNVIGERIAENSNIEYTGESSSNVVSFRNSNNSKNLNQTITDTNASNSYSSEESTSREVCTYKKNQSYVMLYIQMALCEQTLEQWLRDKRSAMPEPIVRAIFQQILCGVDYMHSQKIVHHDIKPSNIFISTTGQLQIQLGDFGLACPLRTENHHSVVGTHLYAAPEQLEGKCDPKSDIYSIGIVLVELLISIKTQMELCRIINSLKNDKVPEVLKQHKWAQTVKQLVQKDPTKRPSTEQLLKDINNDNDDIVLNELKKTIMKLESDNYIKDNTIQQLQGQIASLKKKVKILYYLKKQ